MANFVRHTPCDICGSSDARALYDDGSWHCFSCGSTKPSDEYRKQTDSHVRARQFMQENIEVKSNKPCITQEENQEIKSRTTPKGNKFRGIRDEITTYFGVRTEFDEEDAVVARYYPCTQDGQLVGYKIREIPKDFRSVGRTGAECELFGQFRFTRGGKYVLVTEGEEDCLAAYQMLSDYNKSRGVDYETAVVSPTTGANSYKQIANQYKFFDSFDNIVLAYDNDKAGRDAIEKIVKYLPKGKVKIVNLRYKDPNDYLLNAAEKEFIRDFYEAKPYIPVGVIGSTQLYNRILEQASIPKVPFPPFMSKLNEMLVGGLPLGHIVNIAAGTGLGKCLAKGTLVRMHDMTTKKVEDIKVGDLVMGPDGKGRLVTGVTSGVDDMYEVTQKKGMTYVVNSSHILSFKASCDYKGWKKSQVVNIEVKDYLKLTQKEKDILKGYKADFAVSTESSVCEQNEDCSLTEVTVKPVGKGEYYGFELSGPDRLFCLEDFTVTHNSSFINEMVYYWIFNSPHKIGIVSMELDAGQYGEVILGRHLSRKLALISDENKKKQYLESDFVKKKAQELFFTEDGNDRFYLLDNRDGSVQEIQDTIEELVIACGCRIIVLDPLQDILDGLTIDEQAVFMKWCKGIIKSHNCTLILINHVRKASSSTANSAKGDVFTEDEIQGSSTIIKSASVNILLSRNKYSEDEVERNTTKVFLSKNRICGLTGPAGEVFYENETNTLWDKEQYFSTTTDAPPED